MKDNKFDLWDEVGYYAPWDFFKKKNWRVTKKLIKLGAAFGILSVGFMYLYMAFIVWLWYM